MQKMMAWALEIHSPRLKEITVEQVDLRTNSDNQTDSKRWFHVGDSVMWEKDDGLKFGRLGLTPGPATCSTCDLTTNLLNPIFGNG
jgi:hypothetical protein